VKCVSVMSLVCGTACLGFQTRRIQPPFEKYELYIKPTSGRSWEEKEAVWFKVGHTDAAL